MPTVGYECPFVRQGERGNLWARGGARFDWVKTQQPDYICAFFNGLEDAYRVL